MIKDKICYHSVDEVVEKLKSNRDFVLYELRENRLKGQWFVSGKDLEAYLEQKKINAERKARLEKQAERGLKAYNERNVLIDPYESQKEKKYLDDRALIVKGGF